MSKKNRQSKDAQAPPSRTGMTIDTILEQLASLKDNSQSFIDGRDPEADAIWQKDVEACEAATAILSALQDEGIKDPEQVRDLLHDYAAQAKQYQTMHEKYEVPVKAQRLGDGSTYICPECHRQIYGSPTYCGNCGKRIGWR